MKTLVLIVDDEPDLQEILAWELENSGAFETVCASSGDQAFEAIQNTEHIAFIISDVRMRNGSGIDLIKKCKEANLNIPILLMSGFSDISEQDVIDKGAVGIVTKPIDIEKLIFRINQQAHAG